MRRSRRGQPVVPREGDLVIDGRLRARLLGLHLLDIDAHVVVAPARPALTVRALGSAATASGRQDRRALHGRIGSVPDTPAPELAYAVRLIAEGSSLLDEAAHIH